MRECIAIINQKGGVGKSTVAANLGAGLYLNGYRVLYVDLDTQGDMSYSMGAEAGSTSSYDVLTRATPASEAIQKTAQGDLIPASPSLANADAIITGVGKEYRLKEAIEPLRESYDYIILDTPPSLGILTINALTAATGAIVPAQATVYSLLGVGQLSQTVQAVQTYCNKSLLIKGIVLTRYNPRAIITRDMTELLQETAAQLHTKVYDTKIRECSALKEAQASREDIFTYNSRSNAAKDFKALVTEVLGDQTEPA